MNQGFLSPWSLVQPFLPQWLPASPDDHVLHFRCVLKSLLDGQYQSRTVGIWNIVPCYWRISEDPLSKGLESCDTQHLNCVYPTPGREPSCWVRCHTQEANRGRCLKLRLTIGIPVFRALSQAAGNAEEKDMAEVVSPPFSSVTQLWSYMLLWGRTQNQLFSFDTLVMHLNTGKWGGRTVCSSGSFLCCHFLALLSLRGIEPRAPFLQDSQLPGMGHSWGTPPSLLLMVRGQDYKTHAARKNRGRGAHNRPPQCVGTWEGGEELCVPGHHWLGILYCWSIIQIEEWNLASQSKPCVPWQFIWDLIICFKKLGNGLKMLFMWLNAVMDHTISSCNSETVV